MRTGTPYTESQSADETSRDGPFDGGVSLIALLRVLGRHKRSIAIATICGFVASAGFTMLLSPRFKATAAIMPPRQQQSGLYALLGQFPMAGLAGRDLGLKSPDDVYIGILRSRTVADSLIERFHLRHVYKCETLSETRVRLERQSTIESGRDTLIYVSVEDIDPARAAALANGYVDELYAMNRHLAVTEASQRRLFFERQLEYEKSALADAELNLRGEQQKSGVIHVSSQIEATIASIAQLHGRITVAEAALQRLKLSLTPENPEIVQREVELDATRGALRRLESDSTQPSDPLISPKRLPAAGLELARRLRDVKYHESLFEALSKQYEAARIDEAQQAPVIQVVDRAITPDQRSWPPRAGFVLAGGLGSLIVVCSIVGVRNRFEISAIP